MFNPRRALGRTGFVATSLGIGDLADRSAPPERLVALLHRAMDAGLNVIDTAPNYEAGYSEQIVGKALAGGRGEGMFLVDKVDELEQPVAPQVEASLERLGLDCVDLFVFHSVKTLAEWERLQDGPMAELERCVRAGKARFRGISSHHPEAVAAAIQSGLCDVVLFPIGAYCDARYLECLKLAKEHDVGTICFKTFGAGMLVGDTAGYGRPLEPAPEKPLPRLTIDECVRYTLTCDPDVALLGTSSTEEQDQAFAAARAFRPMSPTELEQTRARAASAIQGKGEVWWNP